MRFSTFSGEALNIHIRGLGGQTRGIFFPFALPPFYLHGLIKVEKGVSAALILSGGILSMYDNGYGDKRACSFLFLFRVHRLIINDWVGGENGVSASTYSKRWHF